MGITEIILLIVVSVVFSIGIVGIIAPVIPSLPLMWGAILIYGAVTSFADVPLQFVMWMGIVALFGTLLDFVANIYGAKVYGASWNGMLGAIIGGFLGLIILNILGMLIGAFVGTFIGEYSKHRTEKTALRAAWGTFIGFIGGTVIKVILSIIMITWFYLYAFGVL